MKQMQKVQHQQGAGEKIQTKAGRRQEIPKKSNNGGSGEGWRERGRKDRKTSEVFSAMALRYLRRLIRSSVLLTLNLTSLAANPHRQL